jgi:hypothetical protein
VAEVGWVAGEITVVAEVIEDGVVVEEVQEEVEGRVVEGLGGMDIVGLP